MRATGEEWSVSVRTGSDDPFPSYTWILTRGGDDWEGGFGGEGGGRGAVLEGAGEGLYELEKLHDLGLVKLHDFEKLHGHE